MGHRDLPHDINIRGRLAPVAAILLLALLVACGSSPATSTPESTPTSTAAPVLEQASPTPPLGMDDVTPGTQEIASTPTPTPSPTSPPPEIRRPVGPRGGQVGNVAPDFVGIAGWVGAEPLSMAGLQGKVVLIDFWTYTCVNCIRTLPYLRDWHRKYADRGLVIVGVHSPEFTFEEDRENVARAMRNHSLEYPVAQDNDFQTWRAYGNQAWPSKYLIDARGYVQYTHRGEGAYAETEAKIRELLLEAGADLRDVEVDTSPEPAYDPVVFAADFRTGLTRELYGGYLRSSLGGYYVAQPEYHSNSDRVLDYVDPGDHQNHFIYLQGPWFSGPESLVHARESESYQDYIAIRFIARSVNAVIEPRVREPFEVQLTMDGRPLRPEEAGADVTFQDGRSFVVVDEPRMYQLVELSVFADHELKLSAKSEGFALFAFTFGAYLEGP